MDEFLILLQAKLDEAKSKGNVNADIKELQNQLDKLKVQVEIDPKTAQKLADNIGKLINQKIVISSIGIDTNAGIKTGQEYGKRVSQGITQGISSATKSTEKVLRDFSELNDAKRKFVDGHDLISKDDIADAERLYDTVRKAFSEFGQVTVSKGLMNDGSLENMRVKIEQVNGEMKITRDFMLYFNESKNGFRLVDDDTIRTTEKMIQHLNEEKNIVNATNEEANAIKEKFAEQEKYYGKLGQATKEQIALEKQRITAGEKQLEILEEQTKRRDSRISYNEGQIDKKGLSDASQQRKINDLEYSGREKIDIAFGKELDKSLLNLSKLKDKWQEQGIYVDEFKSKVELLEKSLNEINIGDVKGLNSFKEQISSLTTEAKQLSQIHEIQLSMDNGHGASEYQNRINAVTASLEKYGVETQEAKRITDSLQSTFDNMKGMDGQELVNQADKLEQEFKAVKASVEQAKLAYDKYMQPVSSEKATSLINRINTFLSKNTRITKDAKIALQGYVDELERGVPLHRWTEINNILKQTENSMRGLHRLGASLKDQMSQAAQSFTQWLSVSSVVMLLVSQLKRMPKEVYEIDTAMTNLYKVTDETGSKYKQFLDSASKSAHELGRSISSLVEQTANWAKLGFSLDEAEQLAKISSIYSNVGEVDNDTAVSDMVTAMKAFNIEASDSITIVDKLNKLGNEYATSAADLGDGLSRSASAMAMSGTDINKTLAMLTGGTEITQNASEFGNFLKIGSMRIRGMKGDLEELGEEVNETVDSISKVQTQILNRTGGKVNIFDDLGNFRDYYDIMKDIAEIYNDLSSTDQADLTEILFGKQRGNQGAALIQAFQSGQIQKALETTLNADGSAMQEQERWMESLEAKTQQFEAAFQSLSNTVVDSDMLKSIVDLGTTGVYSLEGIVKALQSINSLWGLTKSGFFGSLGAVSGLLMNKMGIGERTIMFQW